MELIGIGTTIILTAFALYCVVCAGIDLRARSISKKEAWETYFFGISVSGLFLITSWVVGRVGVALWRGW